MALRGGPARRIPGNPLGSMLRDLDRRTRKTRRKPRPAGDEPRLGGEGLAAPPGPQGPSGPASGPAQAVTVAATETDGRARWTFPAPFRCPPALSALPVDPEPGADRRTVLAALETVTAEYAVVRVWRTRPLRNQGVVDPAEAGLLVHLTATALERC